MRWDSSLFFINEIEGFSLEEHIAPGCWYDDANENFWPAWEWKGPVITEMKCAYQIEKLLR